MRKTGLVAVAAILAGMAGGVLQGTLAGQAQAAELPGDQAIGEHLAEEICSECHIIDPGELAHPADPPSFQTIADDDMVTETSLRVFFQTPHLDMPDLMLTDEDIDHITAYILSLRQAD